MAEARAGRIYKETATERASLRSQARSPCGGFGKGERAFMTSIRAALAVLCALGAGIAHGADLARTTGDRLVELALEPQPLAEALNRLAATCGLEIVFYSSAVDGLTAPALSGTLPVREALERLLSGTALEYEFMDTKRIAIRERAAPPRADDSANDRARTDTPATRGSSAADRFAGREQRPAHELEEMIVTARRREESLQSTPVAVSAFNGAALELRGIHSTDALTQFVPNLQLDGAAPLSGATYNATVFIRGVGQNDFAIFSDPGVAVYLDGVYLGRSIGGILDLVDLERIEVLRGPQGTLFGRNTIGGAVNIVTRAPEDAWQGELSLTAANLSRREARVTLNMPLAETFATRLTAATLQRDGYATRLSAGDALGDKDATLVRLQGLWQPSTRLSAKLALDTTRVRQHSAALTLLDVASSGVPFLNLYNQLVAPGLGIVAPSGAAALDASWITDDLDTTYATGPSVNDLDSWGVSLDVEAQLQHSHLRSLTAWRGLKAVFARDGDNTPFPYRETFNDDRQEQLSQELQWSGTSLERRLEWLLGAYLFEERARERGRATLAMGLYEVLASLDLAEGQTWCGLPGPNPRPSTACPPALRFGGAAHHDNNVLADLDVDLYTQVANRSFALFGQSTLRLNAQWSLTAGLRWTRDEKQVDLEHRRRASNVHIVGAPGHPQRFHAGWSQIAPRLGLEWQRTPDMLLYLAYSRGFKSGGFNGRPLVDAHEASTPYDPEVVDSYELGLKSRLFDGRMTMNAAWFHNTYRDMQLSINATPQNFVRNAGTAHIRGAEAEVVARITPLVDANLALGYLDARYTRLDPQLATLQPPLTLEKAFVKAPDWNVSLGLQIQVPMRVGTLLVRGDYAYKSTTYHDVFNDPRLIQPAHGVLNARAVLSPADANWDVTLFGANLTDERYRLSGNSSIAFGLAESTFAAPRELGLTVRLRF
jgi:iron complex outermembrane receptor protein